MPSVTTRPSPNAIACARALSTAAPTLRGGLAQAVAESWPVVFDAAKAEAYTQGLDLSGTPGAVMQMELL